MREAIKAVVRALAFVLVLPALISFVIRARVIGRDRALEGSTQLLSLLPGLIGQYLRRAFLARTIAGCHESAAISFGTIFSQTAARIDAHVYVGAGCFLGRVHIERDVLIGSGVHITSGRRTHGTADLSVPIREQEGERTLVRIGEGAWIGSAAVVMADVGRHAVVGAGSVVTQPIPDGVVAAGVPARVIRSRTAAELSTAPVVE
jgi:acetyltransferase-like isoleucine patch superfamily enzyme